MPVLPPLIGAAITPMIDSDVILRTAAFFAGSLLIVVLAKILRDKVAERRGHSLPELVAKQDNVAVAVEMAGFVLAMVLGLIGSLVVFGVTWWQQALDLLTTGVLVVLVLMLNDQVMTRVVLRGIDCNLEVAANANLAVAIVRAAGNVASAIVLGAALGHDSALLDRILWVLIGQALLVLLSLAYQWLTPYDDVKEVGAKNVAAALPMGGILLAVGILVAASVSGEGAGWGADLLSLAIDLGIGAVLLFVIRWAGDKFLLPHTTYHEEIQRDRNAGVGFLEAVSYVASAFMTAYFLT